MFVGHALAAFALVVAVARWRGVPAERALQVGLLAGLFATVPDLDILYGPFGAATAVTGAAGLTGAVDAFWETGNLVHRGPTHSLVVGAVAAGAFAAARHDAKTVQAVGAGLLVAIVATVARVSGPVSAAVTAAFLLGGLAIVWLARRWEVSARSVGLVALVGLLSHPFGDLFTGSPPAFFYPLDVTLVAERLTLHPDPTLHLLGAFAVELFVVWVALSVWFAANGRTIRSHVGPRALLGFAYGAAAFVLPAPTLETSYHFVGSVVALGVVGVSPRSVREVDCHAVAATGLAAVTCAAFAYGLAYVAV